MELGEGGREGGKEGGEDSVGGPSIPVIIMIALPVFFWVCVVSYFSHTGQYCVQDNSENSEKKEVQPEINCMVVQRGFKGWKFGYHLTAPIAQLVELDVSNNIEHSIQCNWEPNYLLTF